MVDPEPVDDAVSHEPQRQRVRGLEHLRVLLAHRGQVVDVEEPPVAAGFSSMSKNFARSDGSLQNRFASSVAMWLGTMSRTTPRPASRAASTSAKNSSEPPSSFEIEPGSTTS